MTNLLDSIRAIIQRHRLQISRQGKAPKVIILIVVLHAERGPAID